MASNANNDAWSGLTVGLISAATDTWLNRDQTVRYVLQSSYGGILGLADYEAKRAVLSYARKAIKDIRENARKESLEKFIKERDSKLSEINNRIIQNGASVINDYGSITTINNKKFYAVDIAGRKVNTALILWYTGDYINQYEVVDGKKKGNLYTKDVIVCDLAPSIESSSKRNVAVTEVVGRDYSRKELIGNGDINFRVSGKFVSSNADVYPQDQVSRFIDLARHGGIINVNNLLFGQHNITRIIITDYSLPQPQCLNEQPYSFSCIGVEPDDEVEVKDTIKAVKYDYKIDQMEGWYQSVLAKYIENVAQATLAGASSIAGSMSSYL